MHLYYTKYLYPTCCNYATAFKSLRAPPPIYNLLEKYNELSKRVLFNLGAIQILLLTFPVCTGVSNSFVSCAVLVLPDFI